MAIDNTRKPSVLVKGAGSVYGTAKKAADDRDKEAVDRFIKRPRRFWLGKNKKTNIIILDQGDNTVGAWEHSQFDPRTNKSSDPVCCISEVSVCPMCDAGIKKRFCMFLTILDLSKYTTKNGEEITVSKKILAISSQTLLNQFKELFLQLGKDFRGVVMTMSRGGDDKSPNTGSPTLVLSKSGKVFRFSEAMLAEKYGDSSKFFKSVKLPKDYLLTPYDYEQVLETPTVEEMNKMLGITGDIPGSKAESALPWDSTEENSELNEALNSFSDTPEESDDEAFSDEETADLDDMNAGGSMDEDEDDDL